VLGNLAIMTSEFETLAIHAGAEPDPATGAVVPPIYQVSTFKQDGVGAPRGGYEYSRTANPTRTALEECLAALEGGSQALAFGSGMAAEDCLLRTVLSPGDHVLIPDDAYGGTYRLFARVLANWGITFTAVHLPDSDALAELPARLVWAETPTNPLLNIADIRTLAGIAHEAGALLVVDNTFASPYLQRPLGLGADIVVHSTTKYLGGHSDVVGGAVVVGDAGLGDELAFNRNATGGVPGPFDCWLTLRGIRTLAVRMDRHCENATRVADMLAGHPRVTQVYYPGLPTHPGHKIAAAQMKRFGGMVSFRAAGGAQAAADVCARTRLFTLGESLGGVESLIEVPARMTHASVAGSALEVPADLVRLSVGIEDADDLMEDLRKALENLSRTAGCVTRDQCHTISTRLTSQSTPVTPAMEAMRALAASALCCGLCTWGSSAAAARCCSRRVRSSRSRPTTYRVVEAMTQGLLMTWVTCARTSPKIATPSVPAVYIRVAAN
jgi:cystathionine gamma-synthase